MATLRKIVLTGGPGAGKTVVAGEVSRRLGERVVLVPESATHVYRTLGTRWDRLDLPGRRDAQQRMYLWQIEQERRIKAESPDRPLLLDRGTIDGAAYWPDGHDAFWDAMGTSRAAELARYDAVIFLDTAATLGIYDGASSNDVRFESPEQAIESGKVLLRLWNGHPRLRHVVAFQDIDQKVAAVTQILETELGV